MIKDTKIYIDKGETWDDINGSRLESGYEVNGIKEGIWEYYDPESEILIEKATYKSGMRHGKAYLFLAMDKWNYEHENKVNRVWHECIYKNDDKYQDIYFHRDGGYSVEHLKNWEKHGTQEDYYPNGNIRYKRKFVNGKIEGFDKYFYEDGSKKIVCFKVNGQSHGDYEYYQEDGNFLERRNYEDGYISGLFIKNHRGSKEIECRGSYIPIKNIVNQETSLAMEKNYRIIVEYLKRNKINEKNIIGLTKFFPGDKVSLKSGIWEYYDEQGRLQTRVLFKNGKKVKIFK